MKILKYFETTSLKYFVKFFIFIIKWLKTFKNMIKVYEISRKYIVLFKHINRYLPYLTGLLTLLLWTIHPAPIVHREIFETFQKYFMKYFAERTIVGPNSSPHLRCPGADCKLGLYAIVRPNLLSAPEHETLGNWTDGRISCRHSSATCFLVNISNPLHIFYLQ